MIGGLIHSKPTRENPAGWLPWIILVISLGFAAVATPAMYGDGKEYFLQLMSFAKGHGPALNLRDLAYLNKIQAAPGRTQVLDKASSEELGKVLSSKPTGQACLYTSRDGKIYGCHFFGYAALSAPFFWLLKLFGLNPLNAFIVFNTFLLVGAALFAQRWLRLQPAVYLTTLAVLLLTVGIYYINWPHPEVFTASLAFCSFVAMLRGARRFAFVSLAMASWQNPSVIFFIVPFGIWDLVTIWRSGAERIQQTVRLGLRLLPGALVFAAPFLFYFWKFRVFSLIAGGGYLDRSLISLSRLLSVFVDPNQGLFFWSPIALFIPILTACYFYREKGRRSTMLCVAGAILACTLAALPTLAQINWNAGSMGPIRYSTWLIAPFIALSTFMMAELSPKSRHLMSLCVAALCFQLLWTIRLAGLPANVYYLRLQPAANFFIQNAPRLIPWDAEILYERIRGTEGWDGPQTVSVPSTDESGFVMLTVARPGESIASVCGLNAAIAFPNGRPAGPAAKAGAGEVLAGKHRCVYGTHSSVYPTTSGLGQLVLKSGFAQPESWGTWAVGQESLIAIPLNVPKSDLSVTLWLRAFDGYKHLPTNVTINDCQAANFDVTSDAIKPYKVVVPSRCLEATNGQLLIKLTQGNEIKLPADLGYPAGDSRRLSISLSKVDIGD
ncbi:hypothetical protein [Dyella silvae]|uniref:hypothetical protein n=1 Tax=Dyella silvae TaxID=2994424 RepID=UPI0022643461|nr:hypothetical protein [Dyella silvae]